MGPRQRDDSPFPFRGHAPTSGVGRTVVPQERGADLIAIDDALNTLATQDPRKSQIVELRFFGGLTVEETAVEEI
jgi:ECF sigma factor